MQTTTPPPPQQGQQFRPCYTVNPREGLTHTHTIIFLHGRDSTAEEFASELFESEGTRPFGLPPTVRRGRTLPDLLPTVKWVFPRAPILRSARFGVDMSQWFDMWSAENPSERPELQVPGLKQSIEYIHSVIDTEASLLHGRRSKIFLAGISQGFAAALAAFYAPPKNWTSERAGERNLAGLIGLATWLPFAGALRRFWDKTLASTYDGEFVLSHEHVDGPLEDLNVPYKFIRLVGQFFTTFPGFEDESLLGEEPSEPSRVARASVLSQVSREIQLLSLDRFVAETQQEEEEEDAHHEEAKHQLALQGLWTEYRTVADDFEDKKYNPTLEIMKTPVHLQHCEDDEVVPVGSLREMDAGFRKVIFEVDSRVYKYGGHWLNEPAGVDHFVGFVKYNMR